MHCTGRPVHSVASGSGAMHGGTCTPGMQCHANACISLDAVRASMVVILHEKYFTFPYRRRAANRALEAGSLAH
eukprot:SAG22_NODE_15906_length_337_cov_0.873950_1_plen_73_part_01